MVPALLHRYRWVLGMVLAINYYSDPKSDPYDLYTGAHAAAQHTLRQPSSFRIAISFISLMHNRITN